jgi:hypothetical protein
MLEKEIMLLPPIQINWLHFELEGVLKNMSITIPKDEIGDFIQPRTKHTRFYQKFYQNELNHH